MKKFYFIFVLGFIAFSFNCYSQIKVDSNGKVGINNTSPNYQFDASGDFRIVDGSYSTIFNNGDLYSPDYVSLGTYSNKWYNLYADHPFFQFTPEILSDINHKTDIQNITNVLGQINNLRPVTYKLKKDAIKEIESDKYSDKKLYGLIAQEVSLIFPDIVNEQEDGTQGIRYTELIPILIKAVQEQQEEINALEKRIEKLEENKK